MQCENSIYCHVILLQFICVRKKSSPANLRFLSKEGPKLWKDKKMTTYFEKMAEAENVQRKEKLVFF